MLFYIATQPSSPSSVGPQSSWQVPSPALRELVQLLKSQKGDEVVQHYIVKTIENIATQSPNTAYRWFFSFELLWALSQHVRSSSSEHFRHSCLASAAHLWRGMPEEQMLHAEADMAEPELILAGLQDLAPQGIPHALQLTAQVLLRIPCQVAGKTMPGLPPELCTELLKIASQPRCSSALRGRCTVVLAMLCALDDPRDAQSLRAALEQLPMQLERLAREEEGYLVQSVAAVTSALETTVVGVLQALVDTLRRLPSDGTANLQSQDELAGPVYLLPIFVHLACSPLLCSTILGSRALPLLGAVFDLAARAPAPQGSAPISAEQLQPLVLMVMEALTAQQGLMLEHAPQVIRCLLPALAAFLPSNRAEIRLLALKCFCGICVLFLNDDHIFDPMAEKPTETTLLLETFLCGKALPSLPVLLGDEPPAPSYALRLLATLLSRGSSSAGLAVREMGLARHVLASLRIQQVLAPHTALLAHCLVQARQVSVFELAEAGILDLIKDVLVNAVEVVKEPPAQLDFAMVDAALNVAEEALAQVASGLRTVGSAKPSAWDARQSPPPEFGGCLLESLPLLAVLCAPLSRAKLASLLERATGCCHHLADVAACCPQDLRQQLLQLPPKAISALLESLASVARWKSIDASLSRALQRRLLAVLGEAVAMETSAEVRAEVAAGIERLLRDRGLGEDQSIAAEAHGLVAKAVGRGFAPRAGSPT
mmetsp:Transcript_104045/g.184769  ORF Transcript_104045/g.184769 Transcript_104045/m.184769 type:complete len:713 (+) Transcript_104045:2-2140(+)